MVDSPFPDHVRSRLIMCSGVKTRLHTGAIPQVDVLGMYQSGKKPPTIAMGPSLHGSVEKVVQKGE